MLLTSLNFKLSCLLANSVYKSNLDLFSTSQSISFKLSYCIKTMGSQSLPRYTKNYDYYLWNTFYKNIKL